nr:PREDICTED: uncharacterized protein LOC106706344 [Latimeria chalumnae]|eukprot:XP_014352633.1 PREDICTED: uncharacterized protein LOC106706344 [Latimeria chalumnae]
MSLAFQKEMAICDMLLVKLQLFVLYLQLLSLDVIGFVENGGGIDKDHVALMNKLIANSNSFSHLVLRLHEPDEYCLILAMEMLHLLPHDCEGGCHWCFTCSPLHFGMVLKSGSVADYTYQVIVILCLHKFQVIKISQTIMTEQSHGPLHLGTQVTAQSKPMYCKGRSRRCNKGRG